MKFSATRIIPMFFAYAGAAAALDVPGPLVDSAWLEQHLQQAIVLEIGKKVGDFGTNHIPGARFIEWDKVNVKLVEDGVEYEKMRPSAEGMTALMRASGVNNGDAVVIASIGKSSDDIMFGARLYWILKYYGYNNMALLNGGAAKWVADSKAVAANVTPPAEPGNFEVGAENQEILATTAEVQAAVDKGNAQLVDARTLDYYLGVAQRAYVFGKGHIPGAKHFPHSSLVHWESQPVFIDAKAIDASLQAMGLDTSKPAITYCNSGHLSAGVWFILSEVLGKEGNAMYDGSMHAWTKDATRPLVTMKVE